MEFNPSKCQVLHMPLKRSLQTVSQLKMLDTLVLTSVKICLGAHISIELHQMQTALVATFSAMSLPNMKMSNP